MIENGIPHTKRIQVGKKEAVKRSQPGQHQGFTKFQAEIKVLSKIRHRHPVLLDWIL